MLVLSRVSHQSRHQSVLRPRRYAHPHCKKLHTASFERAAQAVCILMDARTYILGLAHRTGAHISIKASRGLYISAKRPRRSTDRARRSTFVCSSPSPLRIENKAGFPGCNPLAFFALILRPCVYSASKSGVGMVPGIEPSSLKEVGASRSTVLTSKLTTSGTSRFE